MALHVIEYAPRLLETPISRFTHLLTSRPCGPEAACGNAGSIATEHSNAYALWKRMGSPIAPDEDAYARLLKASELAMLDAPDQVQLRRGVGGIAFELPRQGVSLLEIDWTSAGD